MDGYSIYFCRIVQDIDTIVWASTESGADQFHNAIIEVCDSGGSKWPAIVECVRNGIRLPAYEKWLTNFKKQYVALGGKRRFWPEVGVPTYDKSSTDERWAVIEACGWCPVDSDPLSLVEAEDSDVWEIFVLLKGLDFPEAVEAEIITYAGYFYSWKQNVDKKNPALVRYFENLDLVEPGSLSRAPAFYLRLLAFKNLRDICTRIGIKPARSINGTIENILSSQIPVMELGILFDDYLQVSDFIRVKLPEKIVQRQLVSARAYARGLVCFMRDAAFGEAVAIQHLSAL